mmetsp:Transcript_550/g.1205  ORF Transcript_550/g.1205 Transcript_550/m.1205 type:complete len:228 (+) Transcript_550:899-1582(+)
MTRTQMEMIPARVKRKIVAIMLIRQASIIRVKKTRILEKTRHPLPVARMTAKAPPAKKRRVTMTVMRVVLMKRTRARMKKRKSAQVARGKRAKARMTMGVKLTKKMRVLLTKKTVVTLTKRTRVKAEKAATRRALLRPPLWMRAKAMTTKVATVPTTLKMMAATLPLIAQEALEFLGYLHHQRLSKTRQTAAKPVCPHPCQLNQRVDSSSGWEGKRHPRSRSSNRNR